MLENGRKDGAISISSEFKPNPIWRLDAEESLLFLGDEGLELRIDLRKSPTVCNM